jgi:TonB-dependent receptor
MVSTFNIKSIIIFIACFLVQTFVQGQSNAISGIIKDGESGGGTKPLGFANVGIPALNLGATTDMDGKYQILNVPTGTHIITVTYLGYNTYQAEIVVYSDRITEFSHTMMPNEGATLEEVTISAQAIGQMAAINQQVNSNTIVNVISKEKLQELPDQNAAEAIGRLAGVAIQRDGGEGQKVVLRGLSPRFNSITVNGERIPSTDGEDRSVDLSMISPEMLAGVEFYKANRPDMDGDAIGGAVNFTVKKAPKEQRTELRLFGGYNALQKEWGQPRGNFSTSNRFFSNKLGVVLTANGQIVNRSSDNLEATYIPKGTRIITERATLTDRLETRKRYGASLTLDYELNPQNTLLLTSNWSNLNRNELRRRSVFNTDGNNRDYDIRDQKSNTGLLTTSLSGEHNFGKFNLLWRSSVSRSEQNSPDIVSARFRETNAMFTAVNDTAGPDAIIPAFKNDLNNTILYDIRNGSGVTTENNKTFQTDLKYNVKVSKDISGYFKIGGKARLTNRSRDRTENFLRPYLPNENPRETDLFLRNTAGNILLANFVTDYSDPNFLQGNYDIGLGSATGRAKYQAQVAGVDINKYNQFFGTNYQIGNTIDYNNKHIDIDKVRAFDRGYGSRYVSNVDVEAEDYTGEESIYAGYLMGEFYYKKWLMVMGGLRYERTNQQYSSVTATQDDEDPVSGGTRIVNVGLSEGYGEFLPVLQVKIKPVETFDVRLSYTKTLARPDFINLVPWERINNNERAIRRGKSDLRHTTSNNYDAQISFYGKKGMITLGGFYKELTNVDYRRNSRVVSTQSNPLNGYSLTQPENSPDITKVRGIEIDIQSNLRQVNGFLSGVVFGANLTLVSSKTIYPLLNIIPERFIPEPPFFLPPRVVDSIRVGRMPGQADVIANGFVGYEKGRFSGRVSINYQDNTLNFIGIDERADAFNDLSLRVDFAAKYKLDKKGRYQVFLNLNNLTNQPEAASIGLGLQQEREFFNATGEIGFAWRIK